VATIIHSARSLDHLERAFELLRRESPETAGATGYIALYRFLVPQDEVRVLAIRHQREIGFVP